MALNGKRRWLEYRTLVVHLQPLTGFAETTRLRHLESKPCLPYVYTVYAYKAFTDILSSFPPPCPVCGKTIYPSHFLPARTKSFIDNILSVSFGESIRHTYVCVEGRIQFIASQTHFFQYFYTPCLTRIPVLNACERHTGDECRFLHGGNIFGRMIIIGGLAR